MWYFEKKYVCTMRFKKDIYSDLKFIVFEYEKMLRKQFIWNKSILHAMNSINNNTDSSTDKKKNYLI